MKMFQRYAYGEIDALGAPIARALWPRQPAWAVASISEMDAACFAGLVVATRPVKLVEIGVASGWGSCVLLQALATAGVRDAHLHGVDIAERFFYDAAYATGQCVPDVLREHTGRYDLQTGVTIAQCAERIGTNVDFAFIDAHHMHPWATLDLLAVMPLMKPESWVAMHDLNLSLKEDQEHQNRGPKYLFEGWVHDKLHSIQDPPMAGALQLPADPASCLPLLLDIVYTPWELPIEPQYANAVCAGIARAWGEPWAGKFARAIEVGNYRVSKMHSPDIDQLRRELAALRRGATGWVRRVFGERNA